VLFPHLLLPKPKIGDASVGMGFDTLMGGPFDSGCEVALKKRDTTLFDMQVAWARRCWNDYDALRKFHDLMAGRYGLFTFEIPFGAGYLPDDRLGYEGVYVGVGDNAKTVWDLPVINLPATIDETHFRLATNKVNLVYTTDYTLSENAVAAPNDFATGWATEDGGPTGGGTGNPDPVGGTDAWELDFTGAGPKDWYYVETTADNVAVGDSVYVELWLQAPLGTLTVRLYAASEGAPSERTFTTVNVGSEWQRIVAVHQNVTVAGKPRIGISFATGATTGTLMAYKARIGPGRDGKARATYATAPVTGGLLTLSGRFCPAVQCRFGADVLTWKPSVGYTIDIATPIHEDRSAK